MTAAWDREEASQVWTANGGWEMRGDGVESLEPEQARKVAALLERMAQRIEEDREFG